MTSSLADTSVFQHLHTGLEALETQSLRRFRPGPLRPDLLVLCSNDYLGYANQKFEDDALPPAQEVPVGAGAARLVSGNHPCHEALEQAVAAWTGHPDALLFSSGYAANVGLLSALVQKEDVVISDALNHASLIDGCRLARATTVVVPHNDAHAIEQALIQHANAARRWIVTESYFSMDGDTPDLPRLRSLADQYHAGLIVDEAHALGVFGPEGRGACAAAGVHPDATVGTFGKAVGGQGAFVAGPRALTDWLWNRARSFVFSTGVSPWLSQANLVRVRAVQRDDAGRARLHILCEQLRMGLRDLGYTVPSSSQGPIIPIWIGDDRKALAFSARLAELGVAVTAIRPPTVPSGTARLRATVQASLSDNDLRRALEAFKALTP